MHLTSRRAVAATADGRYNDSPIGVVCPWSTGVVMHIQDGSLRLFRVAGIDVYLHWAWLIVAFWFIKERKGEFDSLFWNVAEYLALFGIVLLHEFGHALACRSVGGTANRIMLWPLGGIAFVSPPPRPGAVLWSIAAGPLVNAALVPVSIGLLLVADFQQWDEASPMYKFLMGISQINFGLLIFNLLPIYPLDGGQILQALLWFAIGRARSLFVVSIIGLVIGLAILGVCLLALTQKVPGAAWLMILAAFVAMRSWAGFRQARLLSELADAPRHEDYACPHCKEPPPRGEFWTCGKCQNRFDTFEYQAFCPFCQSRFPETMCPYCYQRSPIDDWLPTVVLARTAVEDGPSGGMP